MAGDLEPGQRTQWVNIYGSDPNKYKGFWKYYNTETPYGRAWCSIINLGTTFTLGFGYYLYRKFKSAKKQE